MKELTQTKKLRGAIIDALHWKTYTFIGPENAVFNGSLTQASEERIAKQILKACKEARLRFVDMPKGYTDEGIEEIGI